VEKIYVKRYFSARDKILTEYLTDWEQGRILGPCAWPVEIEKNYELKKSIKGKAVRQAYLQHIIYIRVLFSHI